jgi:hypothetical protein
VHRQFQRTGMSAAYQAVGALAIMVGLAGTWLAARNPSGWLLCIVSSAMWFPALVTGAQWAAVANCGLSIGICLRNFRLSGVAASDDQEGYVLDLPAQRGAEDTARELVRP